MPTFAQRLLRPAAAAAAVALTGAPLLVAADDGWEQKTDESGRVVQQLKIEAPTMTEEDQYGYFMPERYRCDSCKAVMFHLDKALRERQPKSRRLKQWEYTDIFEDLCKSGFEGYGIKLINGENALSGPGLMREDTLAPGMGAIQMSSENWSKRLGEICRQLTFEDLGEDEMYEHFYKKFSSEQSGTTSGGPPGLSEQLCKKELKQCNYVAGKAATKKEKKDKKEKEKEKKEKKPKTVDVAGGDKKEKKPKTVDAAGGKKDEVAKKLTAEVFLRKLAAKHGVGSEDYVSARTQAEWEKTFVSIASKLFGDKSEL